MLYAPNGKNLALPIVLHPPPSGRLWGVCNTPLPGCVEKGPSYCLAPAPFGSFVGRMQYAPTRDNEKRKMNNEKIRYSAKLAGIPDDPFRYPAKLAGIPDALIFFSHPFLVSRQEKDGFPRKMTENKQQKSRVRAGRIQLRTRHFLRSVWGDTLSRYRMLAIEIISANTPAAVTSAPAP